MNQKELEAVLIVIRKLLTRAFQRRAQNGNMLSGSKVMEKYIFTDRPPHNNHIQPFQILFNLNRSSVSFEQKSSTDVSNLKGTLGHQYGIQWQHIITWVYCKYNFLWFHVFGQVQVSLELEIQPEHLLLDMLRFHMEPQQPQKYKLSFHDLDNFHFNHIKIRIIHMYQYR